MKYTSAQAAKLLRKLNEERDSLLSAELRSREFVAAVGEDPETLRPVYDYRKTQEELDALEAKIRTVKHAINAFNLSHEVPGFAMTVDQLLIRIPQLSAKKTKLAEMADRLPKMREPSYNRGGGNVIDYRYTNYDIAAVKADLDAVSDLLSRAQTALDTLNNTETMEIDL